MARSIVVAALGAIVLGGGPARAQEPPALEPPMEASDDNTPTPPVAEKPARSEKPSHAEAPSDRPLLVIPGVTAPSSTRTARKPATEPALPPLDAPAAEPRPKIPLRLESIPEEEPGGRAERPRPEPKPAAAPPAESRRSISALGRFMGPSATADSARDGFSVESSGDPAVEAAVKRRVEKQVRDALGDRVKDVEVRVAGRSVSIRARASRFWYRWNARRTLESLPMPPGYRGKAVLLD